MFKKLEIIQGHTKHTKKEFLSYTKENIDIKVNVPSAGNTSTLATQKAFSAR